MISKATSVNKKNSLKYDYIFFIKDYFSLVKPKVMTLVVFTAFVGIFVAPVTIHPWIAFISIFCIALGSGADATAVADPDAIPRSGCILSVALKRESCRMVNVTVSAQELVSVNTTS